VRYPVRVRKLGAWLAAIVWASGSVGCAYDMDHLVSIEGQDGGDAQSGDTLAATDTGTGGADTGADTGLRPDAASCASLGTTECLACCLAAAPRAVGALADAAGTCLCQDGPCKSTCSKEFCKPPNHSIETKACASCVASSCKDKVDEAKKSDTSVVTYLACVAGC